MTGTLASKHGCYVTEQQDGLQPDRIVATGLRRLAEPAPRGRTPELWDGRAAERVVDVLTGQSTPAVVTVVGHRAHERLNEGGAFASSGGG
jgi:hypothetical protein